MLLVRGGATRHAPNTRGKLYEPDRGSLARFREDLRRRRAFRRTLRMLEASFVKLSDVLGAALKTTSTFVGKPYKMMIPPVLVRFWCFRLKVTRASAPPLLSCLPRYRYLVDISFEHLSYSLNSVNAGPAACISPRYQGAASAIRPEKHKLIDLSNCVVYYFLWLWRESSRLTCLPRYSSLHHTNMCLLPNTSPSIHCLGSTVRTLGRQRHRLIQHD